MKVLAWLAFPLVATILAMCWAAWRGRSRGPRRSGGAFASVEDFRRFNEALAAPGPRATPEPRRGIGRLTHKPNSPDSAGTTNSSDEPSSTGRGTANAAGTLGAADTLATRKLGSAETFGSAKIAGQGS
jgi:hypothetical protein